ncbi:MAG: hypothetical protein K6D37_12385 [Prevotella sp.]|nr:hypothetical protein [Prevotella sp.]
MEDNKGKLLLYQTPDGELRIEIRLEGETDMTSSRNGRRMSLPPLKYISLNSLKENRRNWDRIITGTSNDSARMAIIPAPRVLAHIEYILHVNGLKTSMFALM